MSTAAPEGDETEAEACASPASNIYSPPAITLALSPTFAFCVSYSTPNNILTLVPLTHRVHSDAANSGTLKHVEANSETTLSVLTGAVYLVEWPAPIGHALPQVLGHALGPPAPHTPRCRGPDCATWKTLA